MRVSASLPMAMIQITDQPICTDDVLHSVISEKAGANVLFLGTTRQFTGDQETVELEYEAYGEMALQMMQRIRSQAMQHWPIIGCSVVHRTGVVQPGEASVAVAVSTPHRGECFRAAEWIMEVLKQQVPIWKRECSPAGQTEWLHPDAGRPHAAPVLDPAFDPQADVELSS